MSQQFDCKTSGCGLRVNYEPMAIPGGVGALFRKTNVPQTTKPVPVYLTCGNGHVHRYVVSGVAPGGPNV
jgi:hypothetical protein